MKSLFWFLVLSLPIVPNLWCIRHASRHEFSSAGEREFWIRVGIFIPVLGGLAYCFIGRRRAIAPGKATPETGTE